jgi:hypothetical protein
MTAVRNRHQGPLRRESSRRHVDLRIVHECRKGIHRQTSGYPVRSLHDVDLIGRVNTSARQPFSLVHESNPIL